jgi:cleavage stimulation factor subunit 3
MGSIRVSVWRPRSWKSVSQKHIPPVCGQRIFFHNSLSYIYIIDPPIKCFAQRHIYLGTDAIAARDLGFTIARQSSRSSHTNGATLTRTDTVTSVLRGSDQPAATSPIKRPPSPDHRKHAPPVTMVPRCISVRGRCRLRGTGTGTGTGTERWDGPPRRRFASPLTWDRDRDREEPPPRRIGRDREEKPVTIPSVISWFCRQLPAPAVFDGEFVVRMIPSYSYVFTLQVLCYFWRFLVD